MGRRNAQIAILGRSGGTRRSAPVLRQVTCGYCMGQRKFQVVKDGKVVGERTCGDCRGRGKVLA